MASYRAARNVETLDRVLGGDHERDRPEPFLEIFGVVPGVELDDQRGANARVWKLRVADRLAVEKDRTQSAGRIDTLRYAVVHHRAEDLHCARRITDELLHRSAERLRDLVEGKMSIGRIDAALGHVHILRRRAHLSRIKRERECNVARDILELG